MRRVGLFPLALLGLVACRSGGKATTPDAADTASEAAPDGDGDGYGEGEDCNDEDSAVHPGAVEVCNGRDDDCDGEVDEDATRTWYEDADGDGFGDGDRPVEACEQPSGTSPVGTDCDDADADVWPGNAEACDGVDNDCDGEVDEEVTGTWYADADGDGYGDPDAAWEGCSRPSGYVDDATDCDDTTAASFPGNAEVCDELDNDCDGEVDEDVTTTFYADADGDGWGDPGTVTEACDLPIGYAAAAGDCDDSNPAVNPDEDEVCNGVDDDCDGTVDERDALDASEWYADADGDGYGDASAATRACSQPSGTVSDATDCDDSDASVHPGADEWCNGLDDDCDGTTDEPSALDALEWYADADGDGYGDASATTTGCSAPSGYVSDATDCDDSDASVHPGATDDCDGVDDDCDGSVDEDAYSGWWLASIDTNAGTIYEIDPATAATTVVAAIPSSFSGAVNTMAVDASGGIGHDYQNLRLVEIDACDGTFTPYSSGHGVGNTCGVVWGPGGKLYGIDATNDTLVEYDPATGLATTIGSLGFDLKNCGLAYDCTNDRLIGADGTLDELFEIDVATGAATNFVSTSVPFSSVGIEYDPASGTILASTGTELYEVDPNTGATTYIGALGGTNIDDLAFYPTCE